MKYLFLLYMDQDRMQALSPREQRELDLASAREDEERKRAGQLLAGEALQGPHTAVCVRRRGGATSVTDGPFVETKEHLGGFVLVEARDRDEAVRLAAMDRFLDLGTTIEIRPIYDYRAQLGRGAGG